MNLIVSLLLPLVSIGAAASPDHVAKEILDTTGVQGGLVVHLGCGDGKLSAALHAGGRFLVHGLDADSKNIEAARKHIQSLGLYGRVSVEQWADASRLPYADNLVRLLVVESAVAVPADEMMRVLAPRGVACVRGRDGAWTKTVKPWPREIDEWTHHLHDAGGNAVAHDTVAGPPQQLQWSAGPSWSRSHGWTPSTSAMVSSDGRLFYINDEALTAVDGTVPDKWFLVARDAFSGVLLWKRPIPSWGSEQFSGTPQHNGRFTMPPHVGRRLVAVGDTVYVTLGTTAPVTALNAATGEPRRVFPETAHADEILCVDGRLVVSLNPPGDREGVAARKQVCAIDLPTGKLLWKKGPFTAVRATRQQDPFGRLELAAGDGQVFLLTETAIESLDLGSGQFVWHLDRPALPKNAVLEIYRSFGVYEYRLTVMVYHDGVLLLAQPEPNVVHTYHTMPGTLYAVEAKTGRLMWKRPYGAWGHDTQPDVFVVTDMVWVHEHAPAEFAASGKSVSPKNQGQIAYAIQGLDLKSGEVKKRFSTKEIFNVGHHHRCYRNKITEQFLMASRRGVEFVDLASGENYLNHWVRSGCLLGNLPCNGLLYVAPHDCGCYIEAKLTGFNALAPKSAAPAPAPVPVEAHLHRGPAYEQISNLKSEISNLKSQISNPQSPTPQSRIPTPSSWPTYRHDARRSGATEEPLDAALKPAWETSVGTRPSGLVVAEGKVFVADVDTHTVHALNAQDGKRSWSYTAGARVDSPPTIHDGLAIFGSADGRVYCLRASDGVLAWRFDAAPWARRVTASDQLESAWPVPGSVLVQEGKVWFAAGRSSYLDGGICVYTLDPRTGQVVKQQTIYSPDPQTDKMPPGDSNFVAGMLNDIPGSDGTSVFIRQMNVSSPAAREGRHLFSTAGYLDPSWHNRTFWKVGNAGTSGIMVLDKDAAYGVEVYASKSRDTVFTPGSQAYRLMRIPLSESGQKSGGKKAKRGESAASDSKAGWKKQVSVRVVALVRAGDTLFAAGPPDVVHPKDPHGSWEGRQGGVLAAFSTTDGRQLSECRLPAPPVWDGMAVAGGRLFISLVDGRITCLGGH